MSNFFQITETFERGGRSYCARLWVDNDRKEASLSFTQDRILFIVNYPVRYGRLWDQGRARKALKARKYGWDLLGSLARAALLERPADAVEALEEYGLGGVA